MSNEEEEDYMSDTFLAKCGDSRPGLVIGNKLRKVKVENEHKLKNAANKTRPIKQIETEKRDEGLAKSISSENKGFTLLQKMGYKPGMALGKKGTGRTEPVPVEIKVGRGGLGKASEMKRKQEARMFMQEHMMKKRLKQQENLKGDFLHRMRNMQREKETQRDLYKSQKVCEQLDSQKNILEPKEVYFWPDNRLPEKEVCEDEEEEDEEDEDEDTLQPDEKLSVLTQYLRNEHLYCVWCGTAYDDCNDLRENCPGNTSEDHG